MSKFLVRIFFLIHFCGSVLYTHLQAQQTKIVDFKSISAHIKLDTLQQKVSGIIETHFTIKKDTDNVFLDAKNFERVEAIVPKSKKTISYVDNKIIFKGKYKEGSTYTVKFKYVTQPKKALYFWGWNAKNLDTTAPNHQQIWSQGQGKYTSHWLPSIDDMNDKIQFGLTIDFDERYQVISNGELVNFEPLNSTDSRWHYKMNEPMSSYLVALAIGKYDKKTSKSSSGIPLENYIYPNRLEDFDSTYKHHKQIFDFLETKIGVPYPWKIYRQVPVRDFLYAGMENTGCTIFSDDFIIDKKTFSDQNYISVNAHELAHQWFGNLVTETNSKHHWLHEGFATFYALLAEKEIFGEDHFYFKLYESAEQLNALTEKNKGAALVAPKGSSLTYYQHGAWAIVALQKLVGEKDFYASVKLFLERFAYKNVTTDDFLAVIAEVSKKDLSTYSKTWLHNKSFPAKEALKIITESGFIKDYLQLAGERTQPLIGKYSYLEKALEFPVNPYLGEEAVQQLADDRGLSIKQKTTRMNLLNKAFETNEPRVLNALANILTNIPESLEPKMKKLLKADSYATVEAALYNLWNNFDSNKKEYLEETKNIQGFNSKNVRTLWLLLALNTPGFSTEERSKFFKELNRYTAPNHNYRVRQNAFQYLEMLQSFSDESLQNLAIGATHPNWRFKNFCKTIFERLLENEKYFNRLKRLKPTFPDKVQQLIK